LINYTLLNKRQRVFRNVFIGIYHTIYPILQLFLSNQTIADAWNPGPGISLYTKANIECPHVLYRHVPDQPIEDQLEPVKAKRTGCEATAHARYLKTPIKLPSNTQQETHYPIQQSRIQDSHSIIGMDYPPLSTGGNCQLFRQWLPLLCFRRLIETHHKALDIPAPFFYIMISCLANHDTIAERAAQETVRVNRLPTEAHLEARQIPAAVASGILQLYQGC
jgi:hypothetical protein